MTRPLIGGYLSRVSQRRLNSDDRATTRPLGALLR